MSTAPGGQITYSPITYIPGHFGNANASCMMAVSERRVGSTATGDAPVYVYCQQPDGSYKEVSAQLFGSTPYINNNYPAVGDFTGDGIDSVVFVEFEDAASQQTGQTVAYMSNGDGTYTMKTLPSAYTVSIPAGVTVFGANSAVYAVTAADITNSGCLDVVTSTDIVYLGDCHGNFTQSYIKDSASAPIYWSAFLTVCNGGDLFGDGHQDLVEGGATAGNNPAILQMNRVIEVDSGLNVVKEVDLPAPYWNVKYNSQNATNVQVCAVADLTGNGKKDIVIVDDPRPQFTPESNGSWWYGKVEVYMNQGNGSFVDASASALPGFNTSNEFATTLLLQDLNGDGKPDIVLAGNSWNGTTTQANSIWINNGDGTFRQVLGAQEVALYSGYSGFTGYVGPSRGYVGDIVPLPAYGGLGFIMDGAISDSWEYVFAATNLVAN